ncbi:hypothetical protein ACQ4LE_008759 [Meloidogyne hapla]
MFKNYIFNFIIFFIFIYECEKSFADESEGSGNCNNSTVEEQFIKYSIVPDIIPKAPKNLLKLVFNNGSKDFEANLGNILSPTQVKNLPKILKWKTQKNKFYTLAMADPDAPSRINATFRSWQHWLIINIPSNKINRGTVLTEYISSGPYENTGLHRYTFLIYQQEKKFLDFSDNIYLNRSCDFRRGGWNVSDFAIKYNLGTPIAGNFYQSEYDDYIPILYRELGC